LRKKQKLEFKTKRNKEIAQKKKVFLIFLVALLVFGTVSAFVLLRSIHFDLANLFVGREEETTTIESTTAVSPVLEGSANFLALCVSDDAKGTTPEIRFISVINVDLSNMRIRVCALSPKTLAKGDSGFLTLQEHYTEGGITQTKNAVENYSGITIDKYAYSNDTGFKNAIKSMVKTGSLTLHIEQTINYKNEFNLFIPAGKKTMDGDMLLKYFRYNGLQGNSGLDTQAQTICAMLESYINKTNAAKGEALFELLFNAMALTDINATDFYNAKSAIDLLANSKSSLSISVEQNLSLFTASGTKPTKEETTS